MDLSQANHNIEMLEMRPQKTSRRILTLDSDVFPRHTRTAPNVHKCSVKVFAMIHHQDDRNLLGGGRMETCSKKECQRDHK